MQLLLTRPKEQAISMAEAFCRRGHCVHLLPLLRVERLRHDRSVLEQAPAVVVTSANAVPALIGLDSATRVFAVGPETAAAVEEAGFWNVARASGTAKSLLELVSLSWRPENGPLIYASGRHVSVNVAATLVALGYHCERVEVYATEGLRNLPGRARSLLKRNELDAALFMSVRTADVFAELVEKAGLRECCRSMTSVPLSLKISDRLRHLPWRDTQVALSPTRAGILAVVNALSQRYPTPVKADAD
ncbi:uroporphyrinogen-III synthase [Nitratireductor mangrovi]|uniref:Uroporphyrinogen-III synthase n=1 Tax=Nitratireductor mangrovi TaxID=2599600 RepID=A0A5B8KX99_9HYPH|nr:uroporphyrinogen-III synthase [Nitratireductor mangrovi]QDZ00223.1 uroporphyrinogen-III synthase [Nitratireductor mangrovi]